MEIIKFLDAILSLISNHWQIITALGLAVYNVLCKISKSFNYFKNRQKEKELIRKIELQNAFDNCGYTPAKYGMFGETYKIITTCRKFVNYLSDVNYYNNTAQDQLQHFYIHNHYSKNGVYKLLLDSNLTKWKSNFYFDKELIKHLIKIEKLFKKSVLVNCNVMPNLPLWSSKKKVECFADHKNNVKLKQEFEKVLSLLIQYKIRYSLDIHDVIPA